MPLNSRTIAWSAALGLAWARLASAQLSAPAPPARPTMPAVRPPPAATPCVARTASPSAAQVLDVVTVRGTSLGPGCPVRFSDAAHNVFTARVRSASQDTMEVLVPPELAPGAAVLHLPGVPSTAPSLPFRVIPSVPVVRSLSAVSALPGEDVTIFAGNVRPSPEPWVVTIEFTDDTLRRVPVTAWAVETTPGTFDGKVTFTVPDLYAERSADGEKALYENDVAHKRRLVAPKQLYITRGGTSSNRASLGIPSPHAVFLPPVPGSASRGEPVSLRVDNLVPPDGAYQLRIRNACAFQDVPHTLSAGLLRFTAPQLPGSKFTLVVRRGEAESRGIPFTIR